MTNLSKLLVFGIIFFSCSNRLFGMYHMTQKVLAMKKVEEIEEFLKNNNLTAGGIATDALCQLSKDDSVRHEIIDVFIKYASQRNLEYALSLGNFTKKTYGSEQAKKKAAGVSNTAPADEPELLLQDDRSVRGRDVAEVKKRVEDSNQAYRDLRTTIESSHERHCDLVAETIEPTDENRKKVDAILSKFDQDTSHILQDLEDKNKPSQKKRSSFSYSYLTWGCVCAGVVGLVYYLYTSKNHKPVSR
jgi:hypothetical protein